MALTAAQTDRLTDWVNERIPDLSCPLCGGSQWITGDVVAAPVHVHQGIALGGPVVPAAQVICENCGLMLHFAAAAIGL